MNADVKYYELFDAESIVVNWNHHEKIENMHHIGIFYKVILENNDWKDDKDGHDSLGANWYNIDALEESMFHRLFGLNLKKKINNVLRENLWKHIIWN